MSDLPKPPVRDALILLPGSRLVLFLVRVDARAAVVAVPPGEFLEGLCAARALIGFSGLHRDELPLEDLLPWAGSV